MKAQITFNPNEFEHYADYESFIFNVEYEMSVQGGGRPFVVYNDDNTITVDVDTRPFNGLNRPAIDILFDIAKRYGYSEIKTNIQIFN